MAPPPTAASTAVESDGKKADVSKAAVPAVPVDPFTATYGQLLSDVLLLERSVLLKDARLTARVLRSSARLRRFLHPAPSSSSPSPSPSPSPSSPSSPMASLAALFAVVQSLSSPSSVYASVPPPLCSALVPSQLLPKDDVAAEAWHMATARLAEMEGAKEKERKEGAKATAVAMDVDEEKERKEGAKVDDESAGRRQ